MSAVASLNTIVEWCNEITETQRFYTELLGLDQTYFDEAKGWLTYQTNEVTIVFLRRSQPEIAAGEFAIAPGWSGGTAELPSWVIEVDGPAFAGIVERLEEASVPRLGPAMQQPHGQQFVVRDPSGRTIEVYSPGG